MAIDGYFIGAQIKEFNPVFLNARLRKITAESEFSFGFEFFSFGKKTNLLFNVSPNNAHMRIINELKGNSNSNNNFLNILKKEILNGTLTSINQYKKDRIVFFEFSKSDPFLGPVKKTLVYEVMGRNSNLILLDENSYIIDAMKKLFNEDKRSILPNILYSVYPSEKELFSFKYLNEFTNPNDIFSRYMGFSKEFAEFIFNNNLNPDELTIAPTIYIDKKISFHAYDLLLKGEKIAFNDTSSLLNHYYSLTLKSDDFLIKLLLKQEKRLQTKIANLDTELLKNENYELYKNIADNIYMSGLDLNSYYDKFEEFKLDNTLTLNENAQKFYKLYKKLKGSIDFLNTQIASSKEELNYFKDLISTYETFNKDDLIDLKVELTELGLIKEKKQKEKAPKKYLSYNLLNATCIVGKTAKQNEEILKTLAKGNDLWFHVKDYPGAHVILKGEQNEQNIIFAAKEALKHSALKSSEKGYVNYTQVKNVKKLKSKVGFYVNYKNHKVIFVSL